MPRSYAILGFLGLFALVQSAVGCGGDASSADADTVTVYTSVDDPYARALAAEFEAFAAKQAADGRWPRPVALQLVTDSEMQKTVGLANRLLADRRNPRADVWFPSEPVQTMRLLAEGDVLAPYISPERDGRPDAWRGDADGHYTMLALRLRVLVRRPDGPAWPDGVPFDLRHLPDALRVLREQGAVAANAPVFAMADARFGTTLTHTAAMVHAWGEEATRAWLTGLREAGTAIVAGNMPVVQAVADGSMPWGITDTDDVFAAQAEQREVELLAVPGTLAIPCTVALVEGARNREAAQRFIDWLLSSAGEAAMARTQARFLPTRPDVEPPAGFPTVAELSPLAVDWAAIDDDRATAVRLIQEIWPAE